MQDITEDKENYYKVVLVTGACIGVLYVLFSEYCLFAWYQEFNDDEPLITDYLPQGSVFVWCVLLLFNVNMFISYALVIFPANNVLDTWFFSDWPKNRKRQACKNFTRACLLVFTIVMALAVWNQLDTFLAITGSLTCTPIAFTLPALFHYKSGAAKTPRQKYVDLAIVAFGTFIMVFCTAFAIITW